MKLKQCLLIPLLLFSFISCSQYSISNTYQANLKTTKKFNINIEISNNNNTPNVGESTFNITNINTLSKELIEIKKNSPNNDEFINQITQKIKYSLSNIGFYEYVNYNYEHKNTDNNLLFTKSAVNTTPETKTILLTTTYFDSIGEFNEVNISAIIEILKSFEYFESQYNLSILFIQNYPGLNNSINSNISEISHLNILSIIELQFENITNKITVLNLDDDIENSRLSKFIKDSIKQNSFNFVALETLSNKDDFKNIIDNNTDYVKILAKKNISEINKFSNFITNILSDMLNKPATPSISITNSIIKLNFELVNNDTIKQILCRLNNEEFFELDNDTLLEIQVPANITIKSVDLFNNESENVSLKLF